MVKTEAKWWRSRKMTDGIRTRAKYEANQAKHEATWARNEGACLAV